MTDLNTLYFEALAIAQREEDVSCPLEPAARRDG